MIRRDFMRSALTLGVASGTGLSLGAATPSAAGKTLGPKYRAGVVGLGWTGVLYDVAKRDGSHRQGPWWDPAYKVEDAKRITPEVDVHRKFHHHDHPGFEGLPSSYAEALWDRPEVELVAGAERDVHRLKIFGDRYGIKALYTDALEMYEKEALDIVAVCTNTKGRAFLTVKAAEAGAKAIFTEKPMAFTLEEADRMVKVCADRGIPLCCGAITTTHPSFAKAKELVTGGAIGEVTSIEARGASAQHQNWSYFLDSPPAWVSATGDTPRRPGGSAEFGGQGILVAENGQVVHFRKGSPGVRISGTKGEIQFSFRPGWQLMQEVTPPSGRKQKVEMPWPEPQFIPPYGAVYSLDDLMKCLAGEMDQPKNSGRRVATAIEVEIALKQSSAQGGARVSLPLQDRSLGLLYDWFR